MHLRISSTRVPRARQLLRNPLILINVSLSFVTPEYPKHETIVLEQEQKALARGMFPHDSIERIPLLARKPLVSAIPPMAHFLLEKESTHVQNLRSAFHL